MNRTTRFTLGFAAIAFAAVAVTLPSDALGAQGYEPSATVAKGKKAKKAKKVQAAKALHNIHCPVMGTINGSMGPAASVTYKGYKVDVCCGGCVGKFQENPDRFLQAALADAKQN